MGMSILLGWLDILYLRDAFKSNSIINDGNLHDSCFVRWNDLNDQFHVTPVAYRADADIMYIGAPIYFVKTVPEFLPLIGIA